MVDSGSIFYGFLEGAKVSKKVSMNMPRPEGVDRNSHGIT